MSFPDYSSQPPLPPYDPQQQQQQPQQQEQQNITRSCNAMIQSPQPISQPNHPNSCPTTPSSIPVDTMYQAPTPPFNHMSSIQWSMNQQPSGPLSYPAIPQPPQQYSYPMPQPNPCLNIPIPPPMQQQQQQPQQQIQSYISVKQPPTPPPTIIPQQPPSPPQIQGYGMMGQPPSPPQQQMQQQQQQQPQMITSQVQGYGMMGQPPSPPQQQIQQQQQPPSPPQIQGFSGMRHSPTPPLPIMHSPVTPPQQFPLQSEQQQQIHMCNRIEQMSAPPTPPSFVPGMNPTISRGGGGGGEQIYKQKRRLSPPPHKVPNIMDDRSEPFREETKVIEECRDYLIKEMVPLLERVRNLLQTKSTPDDNFSNTMYETYQKLCSFKADLHTLLDTVILTPYELAAHSQVSLMCAAYLAQFCLYYSELLCVIVPEEVQREYGPLGCLGVVISHELPFTAMQDQAKKSSITGIVVGKSTFAINGELKAPGESISTLGSLEALVQDVVDVTSDQDNKLKECYPLWRMFNFKIKYEPNKGQPVQIKFRVSVNGMLVEFDTMEIVAVRTNDTQTHSFGAKTFIERLVGTSKDKTVCWNRVANMIQKYFASCTKSSLPTTSEQRGLNDHDFDYLKAHIMGGKDAGITKEDIEALFSQALTPVMSSYKSDAAATKYWDQGVNFGLVPREAALLLARARGGAVLFFCCEKPGNFGVATEAGDCFFIEAKKLAKFKTIGSLVMGERSITKVLTFKRKGPGVYREDTGDWWCNLSISVVDKKDVFDSNEKKAKEKDQGVPDGYIRLE